MKRLDEYSLFDEFSVRGRWYLPEDLADILPGELKFSTSGIQLSLDGVFKSVEARFRADGYKAPVILGTAVSGEPITLLGTFAVRVGKDSEFVSNQLLVGEHIHDRTEPIVRAAMVDFTHLDEWAWSPQFQWDKGAKKGHTGVSFSLEPSELLRVESASPFKLITVTAGVDQHLRRTEIRFNVTKVFRTEFDSLQTVSAARTHVDLLGNLLTLFVGESVYPKKIRFVLTKDSAAIPLDVFMPLRYRRSRINYDLQMVFPLSEIAVEAPTLFREWIANEQKLRPVYALLLSTLHRPDQYVQSAYLSLTQALESFHRIVYGGHYESESTYEQVETAMRAAIPANISPDLVKKLEIMLKYGNQFPLRRRLRDLLGTLGDEAAGKFLGTEKLTDFVGKVVDIRNYLTHHDESSSAGVTSSANDAVSLYNMNQRLRALTTALILQYIGMTESNLLKLFSLRNLNLSQ